MDYGAVRLIVHNIFLADKDGHATWNRLQNTPAHAWTTHDDLDLAFLPFMSDRSTTPEQRALHAVERLLSLPVDHRRFAGALVAGMTSTFLEPAVVKLIKEAIHMNELIRQLEEEAIERGLSKGLQQGLQRGLQQAALQLMQTRFGSLGPDVIAQVESLDATQLQGLVLSKILDVQSLSELLACLPQS